MSLSLPILEQKVAEAQKQWYDAVGEVLHRDRITCTNCPDNDVCEFAFDGYNTDGDCLADK